MSFPTERDSTRAETSKSDKLHMMVSRQVIQSNGSKAYLNVLRNRFWNLKLNNIGSGHELVDKC